MIRSFRHKGLRDLYVTGQSAKVAPDLIARCKRRLSALQAATAVEDLNLPGFGFHKLRGRPVRYSIHVNGPWCITFGWDARTGEATDIDLENYH